MILTKSFRYFFRMQLITVGILLFNSCSSTTLKPSIVWDMSPEQLRVYLKQQDLSEIKSYLNQHTNMQAMEEAFILGPDSLYTIALIFAAKKEWTLYHRAMLTQSYSGSRYGRKLALEHIKEHETFSSADRLDSLKEFLKKYPKENVDWHALAAIWALEKGKVDVAENYWDKFLSNRPAADKFSLSQVILGLKLALLQREPLKANRYMERVVLQFSANKEHISLKKDLQVRPEWRELIRQGDKGAFLLQSLDWKVALLQKKFSATLPILFSRGKKLNDKEILTEKLAFWWSQQVLIEDTGRAIFSANSLRSQRRNVEEGRQRLKSLIEGKTGLNLDQAAYKNLMYWSIRNKRTYAKMEKYRPHFRDDDSLRPYLLTEYLYFFKNANHWADLPEFLHSWYRERRRKLILYPSNIRLLRQIYRDMSLRKKTVLLKQLFEVAIEWGEEDLILESAWNYRISKGSTLRPQEWEKIPDSIRNRVLSDIRLFVFRADQGEDMLPELREHEPDDKMSESQKELDAIIGMLIDYGFNNEALGLARRYHSELSPRSIVDFASRIQAQGLYDTSMRMAAQLTYDDNYNMSREALELFYPKAFFDLMSNFTEEHKLPLSIFYGLVRQESYFAPAVISRAGAVGLSQLMPGTMKEVARKIGYRNPDATNPKTNLKIGSYYLRYLINHRWTNNFAQALMAYNAGLGNIRKWKSRLGRLSGLEFNNNIPLLETRRYVQKVSAHAIYYSVLYHWGDPEAVLRIIYPDNFRTKSKIVNS